MGKFGRFLKDLVLAFFPKDRLPETIKNYVVTFIILYISFFAYSLISSYFGLLKEQTQAIINSQNAIIYKLYKDNTSQSSVETVTKKDLEDAVKKVFSKEILEEIEQQKEELKALHSAVLQLNQNVTDMSSANIDENQIWGSDEKLDWLLTRESPEDSWKMDYTIHNDFDLKLLETQVTDDHLLKFRLKIKDNITGDTLKPIEFTSKLDENLFKKERTNPFEIYTGLELSSDVEPSIVIGLRKDKWSVYGRYGSNDSAIGLVRHFSLRW